MGLPELPVRLEMLQRHLQGIECHLSEQDLLAVGEMTASWSGSDIEVKYHFEYALYMCHIIVTTGGSTTSVHSVRVTYALCMLNICVNVVLMLLCVVDSVQRSGYGASKGGAAIRSPTVRCICF